MKKILFSNLFKILLVLMLIIYVVISPVNIISNKIDAVITLVFSFIILYKSRKNILVFFIAVFILYCNYSVVIGEFIVGGRLGAPMMEVKTIENYGVTIRSLLLFVGIVAVFYKGGNIKFDNLKLVAKNNVVIFYGLFLILTYILLFGVNRNNLSSYTVSITPIYEYSPLIFIFAYYSSGKLKFREILLTILFMLFILQDFYYGGRITSLQLVFLFLITIFLEKLSVKRIIISSFVGVFVNSLVAVYRHSYSLNSVNILGIFNNLKENLFVFDTSVYAFYASATHVMASKFTGIEERISSLYAFIIAIFTGSNNEIGNVTRYVSSNYFTNLGGGIISTHFYFWLGWAGVAFVGILVVYLLNKIGFVTNDYGKIVSLVIVTTSPRWYLYTPLLLFRSIFIMTVLYYLFKISHKMLLKIAGGPS